VIGGDKPRRYFSGRMPNADHRPFNLAERLGAHSDTVLQPQLFLAGPGRGRPRCARSLVVFCGWGNVKKEGKKMRRWEGEKSEVGLRQAQTGKVGMWKWERKNKRVASSFFTLCQEW